MPDRQPPPFFAPLRMPKDASPRTKRINDAVNANISRHNDTVARAEQMLANMPPADVMERLLTPARIRVGMTQAELFPELARQDAPPKPRPPKLYANARLRENRVLRMTLRGAKVREIADELRITKKSVYEIRARLRKSGRLIIPTQKSIRAAIKK